LLCSGRKKTHNCGSWSAERGALRGVPWCPLRAHKMLGGWGTWSSSPPPNSANHLKILCFPCSSGSESHPVLQLHVQPCSTWPPGSVLTLSRSTASNALCNNAEQDYSHFRGGFPWRLAEDRICYMVPVWRVLGALSRGEVTAALSPQRCRQPKPHTQVRLISAQTTPRALFVGVLMEGARGGRPPAVRAPQDGHGLLSVAGQQPSCFPFQGCFNTPEANTSKKWDDVSAPIRACMGSPNPGQC